MGKAAENGIGEMLSCMNIFEQGENLVQSAAARCG